ncbi:MAG: HEPN domain-containing protein [Nitrospiraceae bacterium]
MLNIENNLAAARVPWDTVCFHAQQCAEKYLKALLISRGVAASKSHDLRVLIQRIPGDASLNLNLSRVLLLNRYTIEGRYPGDWEPFDRSVGVEAVEIARSVREAVRSALSPGMLRRAE